MKQISLKMDLRNEMKRSTFILPFALFPSPRQTSLHPPLGSTVLMYAPPSIWDGILIWDRYGGWGGVKIDFQKAAFNRDQKGNVQIILLMHLYTENFHLFPKSHKKVMKIRRFTLKKI